MAKASKVVTIHGRSKCCSQLDRNKHANEAVGPPMLLAIFSLPTSARFPPI